MVETIAEKVLKYHRLLPGRNNHRENIKSIIDYYLVEKKCRENIKSITDYYMVETFSEKILKVSQTITSTTDSNLEEKNAEKILKVLQIITWWKP